MIKKTVLLKKYKTLKKKKNRIFNLNRFFLFCILSKFCILPSLRWGSCKQHIQLLCSDVWLSTKETEPPTAQPMCAHVLARKLLFQSWLNLPRLKWQGTSHFRIVCSIRKSKQCLLVLCAWGCASMKVLNKVHKIHVYQTPKSGKFCGGNLCEQKLLGWWLQGEPPPPPHPCILDML